MAKMIGTTMWDMRCMIQSVSIRPYGHSTMRCPFHYINHVTFPPLPSRALNLDFSLAPLSHHCLLHITEYTWKLHRFSGCGRRNFDSQCMWRLLPEVYIYADVACEASSGQLIKTAACSCIQLSARSAAVSPDDKLATQIRWTQVAESCDSAIPDPGNSSRSDRLEIKTLFLTMWVGITLAQFEHHAVDRCLSPLLFSSLQRAWWCC